MAESTSTHAIHGGVHSHGGTLFSQSIFHGDIYVGTSPAVEEPLIKREFLSQHESNDSVIPNEITGLLPTSSDSWEQNVKKLSTTNKTLFQNHVRADLPGYISALTAACRSEQDPNVSLTIPQWFEPIFQLLHIHKSSATVNTTVGIDPPSLVLGGVHCIIQLSSDNLRYQRRLVVELLRISQKVKVTFQYDRATFRTESSVQDELVKVYVGLLNFCNAALGFISDAEDLQRSKKALWKLSLRHNADTIFDELTVQLKDDIENLCDNLMFFQIKQQELNTGLTLDATALSRVISDFKHRVRHRKENVLKKQKILADIPATDYATHFYMACKSHLEGTGQWLLEHSVYLEWKDCTTSSLLWIKGKPGCGKTILSAVVVDDLHLLIDPKIAVAYVYCRAQEDLASDPAVIMCSLFQQLAEQCSENLRALDKAFDTYSSKHSKSTIWMKLQSLIPILISKFSHVFLVIDGLDECQNSVNVASDLLSLLQEASATILKILVFSRAEQFSLSSTFEPYPSLQITFTENGMDIQRYINTKLLESPLKAFKDPDTQSLVGRVLLDKSEGMFLYAYLVIESLLTEPGTKEHILERAQSFRKGKLAEIYDDCIKIICDQSDQARAIAFKTIMLTLNTMRPLSTREMLQALAVEPGLVHEEVFDDPHEVTALCANLISIDSRDHFCLVHASLKDHLTMPSALAGDLLQDFRLLHVQANRIIAEICMTYMIMELCSVPVNFTDDIPKLYEKKAFSKYAATMWTDHLKDGLETSLHDKILTVVNNKPLITVLYQIYAWERKSMRTFIPSPPGPLHFLAIYGLLQTARSFPNVQEYLDVEHIGYTPIDYAVYFEHRDMATWLIEQATTCDRATYQLDCKAIHFAATQDWAVIVEMLVRKGHNKNNLHWNEMQTPLHTALIAHAKQTLLALIRLGADVNIPDKNGVTPLHYAIERSDDMVVEALLDKGANVHAKPKIFEQQTPVHIAARLNKTRITQLLIEKGADPDAVCVRGITALHVAAFHGSIDTVTHLLKRKANIYAVDDGGCNALHYAARCGLKSIFVQLLDAGLDVNSVNKEGSTALHMSAVSGHKSIVEIICKRSDVDFRDSRNRTALHIAFLGNQLDVANVLLERGANPNISIPPKEMTVLHIAANRNFHELLEPLRQRDTNVNARMAGGRTVLQEAIISGNFDFARNLVEIFEGIDIDAQDSHGRSALHYAAFQEHPQIISYLISRGAAQFPDSSGNLALHIAAFQGNHGCVEAFLASEPQLARVKGQGGRTVLSFAAESGFLQIISTIPFHLVEVNTVDEYGRVPIQHALGSGHVAMAKELLKRGASRVVTDNNGGNLLHCVAGFADDLALLDMLLSDCMVTQVDHAGFTPLHVAIGVDSQNASDVFLQRDPSAARIGLKKGRSCADLAAATGSVTTLQKLVSVGNTVTPLTVYCAAAAGRVKVLEKLHTLNIRHDFLDDAGNSPLTVAAFLCRKSCVVRLLQMGADVNTVNPITQMNALCHATISQGLWTAAVLIDAGADPLQRDIYGFNALDYGRSFRLFEGLTMFSQNAQSSEVFSSDAYETYWKQTSVKLCKDLLKLSTLNERDKRDTIMDTLGRLLILLRYHQPSVAPLPFFELFMPPESSITTPYPAKCSLCSAKLTNVGGFTCSKCFSICLCVNCNLALKKDYNGNATIQDALTIKRYLSMAVGKLRYLFEEFSGSKTWELDALASKCMENAEIKLWLESKLLQYREWNDVYNQDGRFSHWIDRDSEFLQLIFDIWQLNTVTAVSNEYMRNERLQTRKRALRLQMAEISSDVEYPPFSCLNHEFLEITKSGYEELRKDTSIFDDSGFITSEWLNSVIKTLEEELCPGLPGKWIDDSLEASWAAAASNNSTQPVQTAEQIRIVRQIASILRQDLANQLHTYQGTSTDFNGFNVLNHWLSDFSDMKDIGIEKFCPTSKALGAYKPYRDIIYDKSSADDCFRLFEIHMIDEVFAKREIEQPNAEVKPWLEL